MKPQLAALFEKIPDPWKATAVLRLFGWWKIPLLSFVRPRVLELTRERAVLKIPLSSRTKNHLDSMYFGALAIGADCVVGILALHEAHQKKAKVHFSFKDFRADFLRRPESDVLFVCDEGKAISKFVDQIAQSGERGNLSVNAYAALASDPEVPVANFTLTISLKRKS